MMEQIKERYLLSVERIKKIQSEKTVEEKFQEFFEKTSRFILLIDEVWKKIESGEEERLNLDQRKEQNKLLYEDVLPENYNTSYGNPVYAQQQLGETYSKILSFLYTEVRGEIVYVFEKNLLYMTICNELFIEIYNCFEEQKQPEYEELHQIVYWYASDYADVFAADRVLDLIDPERDFATKIVMESDLSTPDYLYKYGEYVTDNEIRTAAHLNHLPEETLQKMADTYP